MSHHGSDWDEDARRAMSATMKEIFGEFPNGRLNKEVENPIFAGDFAHNEGCKRCAAAIRSLLNHPA